MKLTKTQLKEIIREEIKNVSEAKETGLMVYPITKQDETKILKWLERSDYWGEWQRGGYFLFPEKKSNYDDLERELEKEFRKYDIDARFEGV
jgi:hypothetical protein